MADLEQILQQPHDSEVNAGVQTFYDTGRVDRPNGDEAICPIFTLSGGCCLGTPAQGAAESRPANDRAKGARNNG
jgi:hypothetical protein